MDVHIQCALISALVGGICYLVMQRASQVLSPRLCKAYTFLTRLEQQEWDSRWASIAHAAIVSALCLHLLFFSTVFTEEAAAGAGTALLPPPLRTTLLSHATIGFSLGYFIVDVLVMALTPGLAGIEMFVHHAIAMLGLYTCNAENQGHIYMSAMLLTELTTPFMNLRWMLEKAGAKSSPAYLYNGVTILVLWALARVAIFVPYGMHVVQHWDTIITHIRPHAIAVTICVPAVLAVLNTFWFTKIVRGALKLVLGGEGQAAEQVVQQEQQQQQQQGQKQQARQQLTGTPGVKVQKVVQAKVHAKAAAQVVQRKALQEQQQNMQAVKTAAGGKARAMPVVVVQAYAGDSRKYSHDD